MILGIAKKIIFCFFLFINFVQPSESADIHKSKKINNKYPSRIIWTKIPTNLKSSNFSNLSVNRFEKLPKHNKVLKQKKEILLADFSEYQEELVIQSDKQSEINNVIYAEGNVLTNLQGENTQKLII